MTTEGRLLAASLGLVTLHARKRAQKKKKTIREEHSGVVMFPHIPTPVGFSHSDADF